MAEYNFWARGPLDRYGPWGEGPSEAETAGWLKGLSALCVRSACCGELYAGSQVPCESQCAQGGLCVLRTLCAVHTGSKLGLCAHSLGRAGTSWNAMPVCLSKLGALPLYRWVLTIFAHSSRLLVLPGRAGTSWDAMPLCLLEPGARASLIGVGLIHFSSQLHSAIPPPWLLALSS